MKIQAQLNDVADFTPLSEGLHKFQIEETPEVQRNDDGTLAVVVRAVCIDEQEKGKIVRRRFSAATPGSRYYLKAFLTALGVSIDADGSFETSNLIGKKFQAIVKHREYINTRGEQSIAADIVENTVQVL